MKSKFRLRSALLVALFGALLGAPSLSAQWSYRTYDPEPDTCETPTGIAIHNYFAGNGVMRADRYVTYASNAATLYLPRNPGNVLQIDPGHFQNCTENSNPNHTQWITFKIFMDNWIDTPNEDHIVIAMRGTFQDMNTLEPSYDARGIIFHRSLGGVVGERFASPAQNAEAFENLGAAWNPDFLQNWTSYQVEMHAAVNGVAYRVTKLNNPQETTGWRYHGLLPGDLPTSGEGLLFGVLCPGYVGDPKCQARWPFSVYFWDIGSGWFAP
jgi:hypothetical protein